ncbi:uncharacterized protein LOC143177304 [Calliopsis andreniformis]|uniref:uncharacterized protein LOC143177304 n=1 Tax=Calliopsis andreniformis TaxID=337506 RepID=UPI003FCCCBB3
MKFFFIQNKYETCQTFKLTNRDIKNPMFVIEYEYVLEELKNESSYKDSINISVLDDSTLVHISNTNITQYANVNDRVDLYNLVTICISGQNINSIDINLDLPNLSEFDVSCNQLQEFPNSNIMKHVKILNISLNNIKLIHIEEICPMLETLDISWNCLISCLATIETLTTFMPNMYTLMICNNPFNDVMDPELENYLIHMHLPNLKFINNYATKNLNMCQSYFPCALNMCKLKKHNKLLSFKQNMMQNGEKNSLMDTKNIENAKYIHLSQNFLAASNILKKILKIQELCLTCCLLITFTITKSLKHLTKLNLGNNFISVLDSFTQEHFPSLKYLDLTNNLIINLGPMGSFHTLQQFYCGNNKIRSITQIDNVKTWHMLYVIDLSNNPINADALYKHFIIFHLTNIKVNKIINKL